MFLPLIASSPLGNVTTSFSLVARFKLVDQVKSLFLTFTVFNKNSTPVFFTAPMFLVKDVKPDEPGIGSPNNKSSVSLL